MRDISKITLLLGAALAVSACDSGTSTAAPADKVAAKPASNAAKDWTKTVVETPAGGYLMGNPDAKVKVIEFASFTCGHCGKFYKDSKDALKAEYVAKGTVSLEYRPFVLNFWDVIAATVAKCEGPSRFYNWTDQLYMNQDAWVAGISTVTEAQVAKLQSLPADKQLLGVADAAKFSDFVRTRGMPRAKFEGCMSNTATAEKLTAQRDAAIKDFNVSGTPSFAINGKLLQGVNTWAQLQPKIREAL